ncbi:MAG: hypothetical protein U9R46_09900 [Bacteroidota bacterium]|nr:hypothetical protein [Bacteroidota bacterium]
MTNPHRLTIHDLIAYLDSQALREEMMYLVTTRTARQFEVEKQKKKMHCSQLLLSLAKQAAIAQQPGTFLSVITELPNE